MELRKRPRTATAKVLENNYIEAETPTPRRVRKARRTAPGFPEGGNEGLAEAGIESDRSPALGEIDNAGGARSVGSNSGAEGSQGQKEKVHEVDRAAADGQTHEDESISKKRRKVGVALQEAEGYEAQGTVTEPCNENQGKKTDPRRTRGQEDIAEMTEADGEKLAAQCGDGSANLSSLDDQSETKPPPNRPETGRFLSGVELPIQPNKRKDIHTSGAENGSETQSAELTPKRPRRSTNERGKANDLSSRQDTPTKRSANGKGRAIKASPEKPDVAAPESPVSSSRRRTRITYKELSDEEEGDGPAPVSARGSSPLRASASRSNKRGKAGVSIKQEVIEQLAPKARKGRKGIWDKEVLLTSKKSRLAKAADLSVRSNHAPNLLLQANNYRMPLTLRLGTSFRPKSKTNVLLFFPPSIRCIFHLIPVMVMVIPMVMQFLPWIFSNPTRSSRTPLWSSRMT